jgi:dienelactone hydrolase
LIARRQGEKKTMRLHTFIRWLAAGAVALWSAGAMAQQLVHFPSLDDGGTMLNGYLYRPAGEGRHPALVFLHGCGGLFGATTINRRETDWAARFTAAGYVVLMVDSLNPRQHGETCSVRGFDLALYRKRPKDAYGALAYLQAQDFVRPDRVGVVGWSQGGGVILYSIGSPSIGRPAGLAPASDFKVAVAFYPGSCSDTRQPAGWTTAIPLLVLIGAEDVWTPLAPCQAFLGTAAARGAAVQVYAYPGAFHDFDWPGLPRRERPEFTTSAGIVPITAEDPAAHADALQRVSAFLAQYLAR